MLHLQHRYFNGDYDYVQSFPWNLFESKSIYLNLFESKVIAI